MSLSGCQFATELHRSSVTGPFKLSGVAGA